MGDKMTKNDEIRKKYGIPKNVDVKVIDYSKLSDREVIDKIKKLESNVNKDETFEDASRINELNILRQEVHRRKLSVTVKDI
jgi:hypothetical protein